MAHPCRWSSSTLSTTLAARTRRCRPGKGSLIYADQRLYLYSEEGVGLAEASPVAYKEHGRISLPQDSGKPHWNHPIISSGMLTVRDQDVVPGYDVRAK